MSAVGLSPTRIVNVAVNLAPTGAALPNLSTLLILGTSTVIDVVQRMRTYTTLAQVATDFGTAAQEYLGAQAWFGQSPQPQSLNIGRWAQAASNGQLIGGPVSAANQVLSVWTAITTGTLAVNINGTGVQNITGLDFHLQTNLNGVASVIQTALRAVATGGFTLATVTWNPGTQNFVFSSGTTGASSTVSFLTAAGSGVDVTAMLAGLSTSPGAYLAAGIVAESALAAVTIFDNLFGTQWYGLTIPSAVDADSEAVAPYIEADNPYHFFGVNTSASGVLTSGTSDVAYILQQAGYNKTSVVYSLNTYAIDSYLARILTTQWSLQNSAITLFGKTLPGITPETLNTTQVTNLEGKNANVYVSYNNGTAQVEQGVCCSGLYVDTVIGVDALRAQIATNLFNAIQTTPTKVPQTDAGEHTLATQIQAACDMFVNNGLIGPGTWNYQGFGQLQQGGYLSTGYYIYTPPVASQSQTSRLARQSVAFQVAAQMAGAVQSVNMTVTVSQ